MNIYTRIVMNWDGDVLEAQAEQYAGPVALCKGKSSTPSVPPPPPEPEPVKQPSSKVEDQRRSFQSQAAKAAGLASTNVTGGALADTAVPTAKKSLLGQ